MNVMLHSGHLTLSEIFAMRQPSYSKLSQPLSPLTWTVDIIDRGGSYSSETLWLPRFRDSRLTDGDEVVSLALEPIIHHSFPKKFR